MSHETELEGPPPSMVPKIFGVLALAVLAIAFSGALIGSLRNEAWNEREDKGEVAREELARIETVLTRARPLLAERAALRARLVDAPDSELRVTQLGNLVERADGSDLPPIPEHGRVPSREDLEDLDDWLDGLYRRVAAGRDVESRLPDLEAELGTLRELAALQSGSRE